MLAGNAPIPIPSAASMVDNGFASDKSRVKGSAFDRLPDEIIELILRLTNPNSFASLILLNRKWRMISQQAHLYSHHLSQCSSYSAAHHPIPEPVDEYNLSRLRRQFAHEIKRNLFDAYLRPRETVINLVSTSISSSSAPGGEAFHFSLSPKGHYVLAYSSSRIHVIDVTGSEVKIQRELKILRRPASTTITDDGSLLAVLSTDLQVDLYDLTGQHPKHTRAVALDHTPRTIALSPTGSVLAAAYDSGVEVSSLDLSHSSTDRRAVKCYAVDSLSFSRDGTQLLGTTLQSRNPSTVVLTAPYYNPGSHLPEESVSALWTTSILFPNGSRDCSHAVLLPSPVDDEASWAFTYDRVFETFRAVRIDDLRNGTTYFTGPTADSESVSKLLPSTLPAASDSGHLVASGFQGSIWIYGVPEDLDAPPNISNGSNSNAESEIGTPSSQLDRRNSAPSLRSINRAREPSNSRTPQWQDLSDRFRNTFVEGRKVGSLDGVSAMNWVHDIFTPFHVERLVAVAPGVRGQPVTTIEDDGMSPVDGGRISILDFDYATTDGIKRMITIEVGQNEPEILEEEHRDLDTEVAIVRRRTVAQRQGNRSNIARASTTVIRPEQPLIPAIQDVSSPFGLPGTPSSRRPRQPAALADQTETASIDDDQEAFDAPYSHSSPRSGTTLRRAATAAAVNRRLNPRVIVQGHIEYRRADGREEHPHESDADNWVPPPPPYSREPIPSLPEHLQKSILADAARSLQRSSTQRAPGLDFPARYSGSLHRSRSTVTLTGESQRQQRIPLHRTMSDATTRTGSSVSIEDEVLRPVTSPVSPDFDDLYDVSPPGTPRQIAAQPSAHQIPRRPVGSSASATTATNVVSVSAMRATLQQPVSPIPQLMSGTMDLQPKDQEGATTAHQVSVPNVETSPSQAALTRGRMEQAVPPRPNDDHHLTEPAPPTPVIQQDDIPELTPSPRRSKTAPTVSQNQQDANDVQPAPIWRRSETAPAPSTGAQVGPALSGMVMPSAAQLARLNSRKGRPPGHVLSDPSRRNSGTFNQPRIAPGNYNYETSPRRSIQNTPPRLTPEQAFRSITTRNAAGARGSRSSQGYMSSHAPHSVSQSSSRGLSLRHSNSRHASSSPDLRPQIQRLDTIHSVTSSGEHSPYMGQIAMTMGRRPSRAERSAAKNIKDAKRKGWRASMRKEKDKVGDGASSAGWTDVSRESRPKARDKTVGKCSVM